jgi:hypothetical protein
MIAVGVANIPQFARITRSAVVTVLAMDYVTAAEAVGTRDVGIMFKRAGRRRPRPGTSSPAHGFYEAAAVCQVGLRCPRMVISLA